MRRAQILSGGFQSIQKCAALLKAGEVVAIPTETVYGLAGLAFREDALAKIFEAKERPHFDPLILHLPPGTLSLAAMEKLGVVDASKLTKEQQAKVEKLTRKFWPGPLTLVLPKLPGVPDLATSGLPTVAVRLPKHPMAQDLIRATGAPLAAPSANRFGRISPTTAEHVAEELGDRIGTILNGGPCEVGLESTILALETVGENSGRFRLLRPGGAPIEEIESVLGEKVLPRPEISEPGDSAHSSETSLEASAGLNQPLAAPGMLASHYAPRKPLLLIPCAPETWVPRITPELRSLLQTAAPRGVGLLSWYGTEQSQDARDSERNCDFLWKTLSAEKDPSLAARRLFSILRELDENPQVDLMIVESRAESRAESIVSGKGSTGQELRGLEFGIQDRLERARGRLALHHSMIAGMIDTIMMPKITK